MAPGQGTGFVSVGDYLDANQGTIANETGQINSQIGGQIDAAKGAADSLIGADKTNYKQGYTGLPGYGDALDKAIAARDQSTAIQTPGGLSNYFKSSFHDTQPQADFDASLVGGRFSDLGTRGSGLVDYLNGGLGGVKPEAAATGGSGPKTMPWGGEKPPPGLPGSPTNPNPVIPDNGVPGDFNHRGGH